MAGQRLQPSRSSNSSSSTEVAGAHQMHRDGLRAVDGGRRRALNDEAGHPGKGGKLRLSRLALFKKKPYDRPPNPSVLDRPLSSGLSGPPPSLPSRLVDSASSLIISSASYLFDSFFKRRRILWIGNDIRSTAGTNSADMEHKGISKRSSNNLDEDVPSLQGPGLEACREKAEGEDLDLAKVEGILKQQFLSREEVNRLTGVLRNRTIGGDVIGCNSEACRQQEKIQQVEEELNPVQLARAYMGERTVHFIRGTPQLENTPYRYGEGAGPSSLKRIKEEVHERNSVRASKAGLASAERMLKRRLIADDEDIVTSRGPSRRVRQKMTIVANTSPYIRQVTAAVGPLKKSSTQFLQLTEKAEKIDETPEDPKLPDKGKSMEVPAIVVTCGDVEPPESSKARENLAVESSKGRENLEACSKKDPFVLPPSSDLEKFSFKPAVEPGETVAPSASKAAEISATVSVAASPSELPTIVSERTKGFHMSAFFEDSSSDEEFGPPVKMPTSSEAPSPESSVAYGAVQENTNKQPNVGSFFSAAESAKESSPILLQPSSAANSNSLPASSSPANLATHSFDSASTHTSTLAHGRSIPLLSSLKPLPAVLHAPSSTEKEFLPFTPAASLRAPSSVVLSTPPISASPSGLTALPTTTSSISVRGPTVAIAPSPSVAEIEPPSFIQKVAAAEGVAAEASGSSPATASPPVISRVTETASIIAPSFTAPAAASKPSVALVTTAAPLSPIGSVASSAAMPAIAPVVFQASTGGAQVDNMTAADSFFKASSGITFTSGSPGADRQNEGDTMATDPMTEEPDSSFVPPSAAPFLFGSVSTVPTSLGQMPSFGSNATSTSPFSFPMPSSAPAGASSPAQFPFSSQSSSTAGQTFSLGASGSSPSNPFLMNTQSSFSFGSSAAPSASPVFTATSSAPVTFPATAAMPSFQFGVHAASSSSVSSTSMFGSQMTPTASAFTAPGGQSNASSFVFSAPTTSSGTPTPPSFQFGGSGGSGPSFGGQSFTFGGQPMPTAGNPFAQSGALNAAPFQFAATPPSQSVFSSGASAPSFGAQPAGSSFPFTFGGQPGAPPTGQPFAFGAQPAAPAQSSFTLSGPTVQNPFASAGASGMDFGGGFSLGAAGGEKSGRKFIKAKRIGGPKRGK